MIPIYYENLPQWTLSITGPLLMTNFWLMLIVNHPRKTLNIILECIDIMIS